MGKPVVLIAGGDLAAKAAAFDERRIEVAICGVTEEELCR
jgi:hypothetical protein